MQSNENVESQPRSLRQQQVLEEAVDRPEASIDDLAGAVSSATPEFVERVLDEYGDPAGDGGGSTGSSGVSGQSAAIATPENGPPMDSSDVTMTDSPDGSDGGGQDRDTDSDLADGTVEVPAIEDLPERQQDLLAAVAEQPAATQETIADQFDVTSATVSRWAKDVEGFDWRDREAFVDAVFADGPASGLTTDGGPATEPTDGSAVASNGTTRGAPASEADTADLGEERESDQEVEEGESGLEALEARIAALEDAEGAAVGEAGGVFEDPELVHKVLHACLQADAIDDAEELRLIEALLE